MARKTFVVGHKNPDRDSVFSALAHTERLRPQGVDDVVSARLGEIWREARLVLDRLSMPLPILTNDMRPCASNVMSVTPIVAQSDESAHWVARRLREHRIHTMPLVDGDEWLVGPITVEDFAEILLTDLKRGLIDQIHLEVRSIVPTRGRRLPVEAKNWRRRDALTASLDELLDKVIPILPRVIRQLRARGSLA